MKRALVGAALAATLFAAHAQSPEDEHRYRALISELRCLVCQNQSIAESNAPLAEDLRNQVRDQMAAGRSDAEIIDFLTARYGDFVRYRPAFKGRTLLLWLGPFALLAAAVGAAMFFIRRSRREVAPGAPDPAALARLLKEEERGP
jgi:cytochrome c-type biogenesis protein CcmH